MILSIHLGKLVHSIKVLLVLLKFSGGGGETPGVNDWECPSYFIYKGKNQRFGLF